MSGQTLLVLPLVKYVREKHDNMLSQKLATTAITSTLSKEWNLGGGSAHELLSSLSSSIFRGPGELIALLFGPPCLWSIYMCGGIVLVILLIPLRLVFGGDEV